jgi:site-specific recombinase XerD
MDSQARPVPWMWAPWAAAMRRRNLAAGTIAYRRRELLSWDTHIGDRWATATRADVEAWLDGRPGLGVRARYGAISHLHAFYVWAQRDGLADRDPTTLVERPRLPGRLPRPARQGAVSRAVGLGDTPVTIAVALAAYAGLRCCEIAALGWDDVDIGGGTLLVRGKGDRERIVPIGRFLYPILGAHDGERGPVLGRRMTAGRVSQLMNGHLRAIGAGATAHQLRHYFATTLLHLCRDLTVVQAALGHATPATTAIYARVDPDAVRDAINLW